MTGDYCVLCGKATGLSEEESRMPKFRTWDGAPHGWLHACAECAAAIERRLRRKPVLQ